MHSLQVNPMLGVIQQWPKDYVFIKPLPVGTHKIELEVLRNPQEPNQPVEYPIVKYTINVIPAK